MKNLIFLILVFSSFLVRSQGHKQENTTNSKTQDITLDTLVRYGKLDNGFTYYLLKNDHPANMIRFELIVKAGHINEDEDQLEYAHLLEHLLASSTDQYPDISKYLNELGGYNNASISSRYTRYYLDLPSTNRQAITKMIGLLYDWAKSGNFLDRETIDIERQAIIGEARTLSPNQRWRSNSLITHVIESRGYPVFNQEKNLTNLRDFKPDALNQFYRDWYRPDLEAAIIVGDIDLDSVEYDIQEQFSKLQSTSQQEDKTIYPNDFQIQITGENRFSTIIDSARNNIRLEIVKLTRNLDREPKNAKDLSKAFIQQLFRLMVASKASSFKNQYNPPFENFNPNYGKNFLPDSQLEGTLINLTMEPNKLEAQKKSFQKAITAWKQLQSGLEKEDLLQAKKTVAGFFAPENAHKSSEISQMLIMQFVFGRSAIISANQKKLALNILSKIDLKDIKEYADSYWDLSNNSNFIFFKAPSASVPPPKLIKRWIEEINAMPIEPLPKKPSINSLAEISNIPTNGKAEVEEFGTNEIGITTIKLAHGIKIILKPTKPQNENFKNIISLQAFRPHRFPLDKPQKYLTAMLAPEAIQYMGAGPYNKFDLERFKNENGIILNFQSTTENQEINGTSTLDKFPEFLNLFYLYLNLPGKDQEGFKAWKIQKKKEIEGLSIRGSDSFIFDKIVTAWHPEIPVLGLRDLNDLTKAKILESWNSYFASIEDFTFIVTGDFDVENLGPILVNNLSSFPIKKYKLKKNPINLKFPFQKMQKRMEYKDINQVFTNIYFPVKVPSDMKTQIELELLTLALHEKIFERLRNGSYSPKAFGEWIDLQNGIFTFHIQFDSSLGNEEYMKKEALEVFRKLKESGVEESWLKTTIKNKVSSYESQFNIFGYLNFWADYLKSTLENEVDPVRGVLNYGTLMEYFIDVEDINEAATKYMKESQIQVFQGYPENYKAKSG